jgi:hypothetical protein
VLPKKKKKSTRQLDFQILPHGYVGGIVVSIAAFQIFSLF